MELIAKAVAHSCHNAAKYQGLNRAPVELAFHTEDSSLRPFLLCLCIVDVEIPSMSCWNRLHCCPRCDEHRVYRHCCRLYNPFLRAKNRSISQRSPAHTSLVAAATVLGVRSASAVTVLLHAKQPQQGR